jgi:hypothetical protein
MGNPLEEIMLALREEASELRDTEPDVKPDRTKVLIAAAFEELAENIAHRLERDEGCDGRHVLACPLCTEKECCTHCLTVEAP